MLHFIYYCLIYEELPNKPDDYFLRVTGPSVAS